MTIVLGQVDLSVPLRYFLAAWYRIQQFGLHHVRVPDVSNFFIKYEYLSLLLLKRRSFFYLECLRATPSLSEIADAKRRSLRSGSLDFCYRRQEALVGQRA